MIQSFLRIARPHRGSIIFGGFLGFIGVLVTMSQPIVIGNLVDNFNSGKSNNLVVFAICLFTLGTAVTVLQKWILERVGQQIVFELRSKVISHVSRMPILSLGKITHGQIVSRLVSDIYLLRDVISQGLIEVLLGGMTLLIALIMMASINPVLLGFVIGSIIVIVVLVAFVSSLTRPASAKMQEKVGELTTSFTTLLNLARALRACNAEGEIEKRTIVAAAKVRDTGFRLAFLRAVVQAVSGVSVQLIVIAVMAMGAIQVANNTITLGELSSFVLYAALAVTPVATLAGVMSSLNEAAGAYGRVESLLLEPVESRCGSVEPLETKSNHEIIFENVSYEYPCQKGTLKNVSFEIPKGSTTAIVGPSGAGKSTIFHLVAQLDDAKDGQILFRNYDVRSINRQTVRAHLSFVDQNPVLISDTVWENLRIGNPDLSRQSAEDMLTKLQLTSSLRSAEELLDFNVGESGSNLSGGERQRIALARSLLSERAVILMDEPTSNLDSLSENAVREVIESNVFQQTILVIAHRLSTVQSADQIIVVNEGNIEAIGSHQELIDISPTYTEFVRLQKLDG